LLQSAAAASAVAFRKPSCDMIAMTGADMQSELRRHPHAHLHGERRALGEGSERLAAGDAGNRRRVLLAALLTAGFMVAEFAGGLITGSLALLADAGHMLTDAIALALAYLAYRVSARPGTGQMTYGFDRVKVLVAYTNGLTVMLIALWIVVEAMRRLITPQPVLGGAMLAIAVAGLAVNAVVLAILHGGDRGSLNLRGALLHVAGDVLGSTAAIAAAAIILTTGWLPADPLLSALVAVLLLHGAWRLLRESGLILLEAAPRHLDRNVVAADLAANIKGVHDVHHMHLWTLDGRNLMATLHARIASGADAEASIAALKTRLRRRHGVAHATVEVEMSAECPEVTAKRRRNGKA
jgi:cobalt-zinc-cadmium efflux system protein